MLKYKYNNIDNFLKNSKDYFKENIEGLVLIYYCLLMDGIPMEFDEEEMEQKIFQYINIKISPTDKAKILDTFFKFLKNFIKDKLDQIYENSNKKSIVFSDFGRLIDFIPKKLSIRIEKCINIITLINSFKDLFYDRWDDYTTIDETEIRYRNIELIHKYAPEFVEKTNDNISYVKRYSQKQVLDLLTNSQKKLPDVSIYDIKDGFHVEMRMFSLDTLLYGKTASGNSIVKELLRHILYTENFNMNVLTLLNITYDKKYTSGFHPKDLEILEESLLWKDYYTPNQLKKRGRRLFAQEEVDIKLLREYRSLVRQPQSSVRQSQSSSTKKKPKKPSLSGSRSTKPSRKGSKQYNVESIPTRSRQTKKRSRKGKRPSP